MAAVSAGLIARFDSFVNRGSRLPASSLRLLQSDWSAASLLIAYRRRVKSFVKSTSGAVPVRAVTDFQRFSLFVEFFRVLEFYAMPVGDAVKTGTPPKMVLWISFETRTSFLLTYLLLIACILPLATPVQVSDVDDRLCHNLCQCTSKTVDCNHQDRLSFIPSKISLEFNQLHISHAKFHDRGLSRVNFSSITHLISLKIVYSKLESIADDTFLLMDRLQYMDLSHNMFTVIGPRSFGGLNLVNLYLERNQGGLFISPKMFTDLRVTNLYLRSNGIVSISVTPFQNLHIAKLYLFNNSIGSIDRKFEYLFGSPDNLLDLTKNPLHCSCNLSWFLDVINKWRSVPTFVKITCQTPLNLQEKLVNKLSKDEFSCETPSIQKISVDVSEDRLHLVCHAEGSSAPKVSWTQINSNTGGEVPHYEEMTTVNRQSYVSLNVTKLKNDNSFICKTWNEINSSNQVLVRLKLIDDFFKRLKKRPPPVERTDETFDSQLPRNPNPPPETHFLFTKQFSILQMIGAVVGTFTSVIVLIFVICCTQEHLSKKESATNSYWTIVPTQMKSSSSRTMSKTAVPGSMAMVTSSSSQDYDIPQYQESNNFMQGYYTERGVPHYVDVKPTNHFSTVT